MGDLRAGTDGSTVSQPTGKRIARHSAEQVTDRPYVGRRVAQQFENGILCCRVRRLLHLQTISRRRAAAKARGGYIDLRSRAGARTPTLSVSKLRRRSGTAVPTVVNELNRQSGIVGLGRRCLD